MRKVAVCAAAVVLFLVLLVLVLPRLVSVESLKPRVVAALEEKTGRRIGLSGLSLSLFPGIGVKVTGLTVSGDPRHPGERLLSAPETDIRMAIAPLLSGRTEFTKFILRRPEIRFRTYADGTHSATGIGKRLAGEKKPAAPSAGKKEKEVAVAVKAVRVEQATLVLVSEEAGGKESRWEISPITVRMSGIGDGRNDFEISSRVEGQVRGEVSFAGRLVRDLGEGEDRAASAIRGEGKLFGQKVSVTGKVFATREPIAVDLAISFPGIEIDTIAEILKDPPASLAKAKLAGVIPLTVKVSGSLKSPAFEARADLTRAGGTILEDPELRKYLGTPCTIVAKGRYAPDRLVLSNAELRIPPLSVAANAVVNPASGVREWAASAVISSLAELGKLRGAGPLP
ncbi:MAG: AsmA family protein, partial [Deltaproteobacteria bacterium]|nr:AsmA family protein [Deltaproteobacteria bacterium]